MKSNWPVKKLGEVCRVRNGFAFKSSDFIEFGVPVIKISNIKFTWIVDLSNSVKVPPSFAERYKDFLIKEGDILIAMSGATTGKAGIYDSKEPALLNQRVGKFEPYLKLIDSTYLKFIVQKISDVVLSKARGAAQPNISSKVIEAIEIPVPPLDEQRRIVIKLEKILTKIDGAIRLRQDSEMESSKIFDSALVKLINNLYAKKVRLGEVCRYAGGTQPPKSTFIYEPRDGYIRLLQIRDYKSDSRAVYIPTNVRHKTCNENDIMIGRYGPPVFQILRGKAGAYNVALIKCIPDTKRLYNNWLYYLLRSKLVQERIISLSMRVRQAGVRPDDLDELEIPLPDLKEQNKILAELDGLSEKVQALQRLQEWQLQELELLKHSVLYQAFQEE